MTEDIPLKRLVPQPDTSRIANYHDVTVLYYEDVAAIHDILSRVAKSHPINDLRIQTYESLLRSYNSAKQRAEESGIPVPERTVDMAPPEEPTLEPVVKMVSDEFEIHDLNQLRKVPYDKLPEFRMSIHDPRIWVSGSEGHYHLSLDNANDPDAMTAFNQIVRIIDRRRSAWLKLLHAPYKPYFVVQLLVTGAALAILQWTDYPWIAAVIGILNIAYFFALMLDLFYLRKRRPAVISLNKRDAPGFWERNRDTILVGVLIAVVTAVLTAFLT